MSEIFNPPRGMRDIVDEEAELYEYLFDEFRRTARSKGFQPIITPTIEYFKLFEVKSGEEIRRSMYVFEDKSKRLVALRPEVTASVVRSYVRLMRAKPKPIRLYYIAQCFRYEEPQYARYREFWQGGLEIIGDPDVNADLYVAITASEFLENTGVKHYYKVGNVLVYRGFMRSMGLEEEFQDHILHLIDKDLLDKAIEELQVRIGEENTAIFKKLVEAKDLYTVENIIEDYKNNLGEYYEKVREEHERTRVFIDTLRETGYRVEYDAKLVRGLAYYTGLIFEYKAEHAKLTHSIGGGGRYDGLTTVYGAPFEYFTGLAMGIDRIALVLRETFKPQRKTRIAILVFGNAPLSLGYKVLELLRSENFEAVVYRGRNLSKVLEHANKLGCNYAIIIGEKEASTGMLLLKNMRTGEQKQVNLNTILDELRKAMHSE
ncbi:MAG: histidine--tRNA ligase [Desulfurococcaceae archaeon]